MRTNLSLLLVLLFLLFSLMSCIGDPASLTPCEGDECLNGDGEGPSDGDSQSDGDGQTDGDGQADGDGQTDGDNDGDGDSDPDPDPVICTIPTESTSTLSEAFQLPDCDILELRSDIQAGGSIEVTGEVVLRSSVNATHRVETAGGEVISIQSGGLLTLESIAIEEDNPRQVSLFEVQGSLVLERVRLQDFLLEEMASLFDIQGGDLALFDSAISNNDSFSLTPLVASCRQEGTLILENSTLSGNTRDTDLPTGNDTGVSLGGGMIASENCNISVRATTFENNSFLVSLPSTTPDAPVRLLGGVLSARGGSLQTAEGTRFTGNTLDVGIEESDGVFLAQVELHGGALWLRDVDAQIKETLFSENQINGSLPTSFGTEAALLTSGAGLAYEGNEGHTLHVDKVSFIENSINLTSARDRGRIEGGALAFRARDSNGQGSSSAVLEMVNTTISSNKATSKESGHVRGVGLFLEAPAQEGYYAGILRYSTIYGNEIDAPAEDDQGALHVQLIPGDSDAVESQVNLSMIGVVLRENKNQNEFLSRRDCSGKARLFPPNSTNFNTQQRASVHNFVQAIITPVSGQPCVSWGGSSSGPRVFRQRELEFEELEPMGPYELPVHVPVPANAIEYPDSDYQPRCNGIAGELEEDQLGQTRSGNAVEGLHCYPGAVELQREE